MAEQSIYPVFTQQKLTPAELETLLNSLQQKSRKAFHQLYNLYGGAVYGWIVKTAEEKNLAQAIFIQTFLHACQNIAEFNPSKSSLLVWLIQLSNQALKPYIGSALSARVKIQTK